MRPLSFNAALFNMPDGIAEHIESSIARQLPEFKPALCVNDGTFVIAASGPSLANHLKDVKAEIAKGRPVCAINGAHDWLIKNGVYPDLFVSIDPRDTRHNVQLPSDKTIYLLASRCNPILFDHLKDRPVMLWHAATGAEDEMEVLRKHKVPTAIWGMSTSGLRAINIGYFMGFRKFVAYGMDSCNAPDGVTKRVDGALTGKVMDVHVGNRKFICNVAMAKQAEDFQYVYEMMPDMTIDVKGDGLIAAIVAERRRLGKAA